MLSATTAHHDFIRFPLDIAKVLACGTACNRLGAALRVPALEIDLALHDWLKYRAAPETFHRVFRDPYLEQAISRAFGLLAVLGLILQIRGWRGWRFSRLAISVPVLEATFVAANNVFGILVTCCG